MIRFYVVMIVVPLFYLACVTTSETKRKQLNFIPDKQMNTLGAQAYQDILKKEKLSTNKVLTQKLVTIGRRIAAASGKNFNWEFKLIESKQVNAFCLPGGKVAFYTGILPLAKNNAGLAAIMGHEVAHAVLKHGAERMSQAIALQAGVVASALTFRNSKYRNLIAASIGIGGQFGVMLPFSRSHESEADKVGLAYMAKAGYDPAEAPLLWERMAKKGGGAPEILSTHPDPKRRARDLRNQIPKVAGAYGSSAKIPTTNL